MGSMFPTFTQGGDSHGFTLLNLSVWAPQAASREYCRIHSANFDTCVLKNKTGSSPSKRENIIFSWDSRHAVAMRTKHKALVCVPVGPSLQHQRYEVSSSCKWLAVLQLGRKSNVHTADVAELVCRGIWLTWPHEMEAANAAVYTVHTIDSLCLFCAEGQGSFCHWVFCHVFCRHESLCRWCQRLLAPLPAASWGILVRMCARLQTSTRQLVMCWSVVSFMHSRKSCQPPYTSL